MRGVNAELEEEDEDDDEEEDDDDDDEEDEDEHDNGGGGVELFIAQLNNNFPHWSNIKWLLNTFTNSKLMKQHLHWVSLLF